jgi:hypothetical protein
MLVSFVSAADLASSVSTTFDELNKFRYRNGWRIIFS